MNDARKHPQDLAALVRTAWIEAFPGAAGAPDENAFDLGADSLDCAQLVYSLEAELGCRIGGVAFLVDATLANLTMLVRKAKAGPEQDS